MCFRKKKKQTKELEVKGEKVQKSSQSKKVESTKKVEKQTKEKGEKTMKKEEKKGEKKPATKPAPAKKAAPAKKEVEAPARKAVYRVVYDKEDGLWKIKKDGAARVIDSRKTKEEALARVQELSENQDVKFVVHKKDGKMQKKANLNLKTSK